MIRLLAPRYWGGHLVMVLALAAATGLGLWQLHAWQDRRDAAKVDLSTAAPRPLGDVMGGDSPFPGHDVGRPVELSGRWLAGSTVYVSGREHDGRDGYWVVTPLKVTGTDSAMPVVRGWSPRPSAPTPTGTPHLDAWLQPGMGDGLADPDPNDDVLPELRIASLVQRIDTDLYSGYVIAEQPGPGLAAVRPEQAPEVGQTTALRNFLYALEWWVFGGFALVVWARWCRDVLDPERSEPRVDAPVGSGV